MLLPNKIYLSICQNFEKSQAISNMGFQFGISDSYAQNRYTFTIMLLLRCLNLPDEEFLKDAIQGHKVAIDVTYTQRIEVCNLPVRGLSF